MQPTRFTVDEFHRCSELGIFNKLAELIRGVVFAPAPKTPLHRRTSQFLYDHLLSLKLQGYTVFAPSPLTLHDSEPMPDICVVAGDVSEFDERHPSTAELVIEVAVTTIDADYAKAAIYAEAAVKEYWIVLPTEQKVEVYRRPHGGHYAERHVFTRDEVLVCAALPAIRVSLESLFA